MHYQSCDRQRFRSLLSLILTVLLVASLFSAVSASAQEEDGKFNTGASGVEAEQTTVPPTPQSPDELGGKNALLSDTPEQESASEKELRDNESSTASTTTSEDPVAAPELKNEVSFEHLGSGPQGTEKYDFQAEVEFSSEVEDFDSPTKSVSFVQTNMPSDEDERVGIEKLESPRVNDEELDEYMVEYLSYAGTVLDERGNEVEIPADIKGDLISFDTSTVKLQGAVTFSVTVYADSVYDRVPEWDLYSGEHSAFTLGNAPEAVATPRAARSAGSSPYVPRQFWINTGKKDPKIYRMLISDEFPSPETKYYVDKEIATDIAYGDIAITNDASRLYAIEFVGKGRPVKGYSEFTLDTYDPNSESLVGRSKIRVPYRDTNGSLTPPELNSLSVDYDGNLLVSTAKSDVIWKIYLPECAKDGAVCSYENRREVEEQNFKFPKRYGASGDFVVAPDGGLYGFATSDRGSAARDAHLVYWAPNVPNDPSKGRKAEAVDLGELSGTAYGGGRIDDAILTVDGITNGRYSGRGVYVNTIDGYPTRVPIELGGFSDDKVTSKEGIEWPPSRSLLTTTGEYWGATSTGESGPTPNERYLKIEKDLPQGRVHESHQFKLSARRPNSEGSLFAPVVTSGQAAGVQKEVYRGYARVGSEYVVSEQLVDKNGQKIVPGSGRGSGKISDYDTSLQCVAGSTFDPAKPKLLDSLVGNQSDKHVKVEYDEKENTRSTKFVLPATNEDTISCRFVNSFVKVEKYPRADRDPAEPVSVDGGNRAVLTYHVEVKNDTSRVHNSGAIKDKIRFPESVSSVGDATISGDLFGANSDKPKSDRAGFKNLRETWPKEQIKPGDSLPLADNIRLAPGERAVLTIQLPVKVAEGLSDDGWERLGVCNFDGPKYQKGGVPNEVNMSGDADGFDNNVACIPLKRSEAVGFQLYKLGNVDGSYVPVDEAEFALYEYDVNSNGKKVLGEKISEEIIVNPEGKASFTGLNLNKDYALVETKAPSGYSLLTEPICFQLVRDEKGQTVAQLCKESKSRHEENFFATDLTSDSGDLEYLNKDTAFINVVNTKPGALPDAGGRGISLAVLLGSILIGLGVIFTRLRRFA